MALVDENGVPKSRPVPQDVHIAAANAEADLKRAIEITMLKRNLIYPDAVKYVQEHGVAGILEDHNAPQLQPEHTAGVLVAPTSALGTTTVPLPGHLTPLTPLSANKQLGTTNTVPLTPLLSKK